jgi:glutamate--glyoxylate aminotransferase
VGNPQALGQKPLTFPRQVLSLLMAPFLLDDPNVYSMFPSDAIERARHYQKVLGGGVGAYQDSKGNMSIRQEISNFIEAGSGAKSDPNNIFIGNGASEVVRNLMRVMITDESDGVMVPIPQYPLYSASIALYGGTMCGYYLDEKKGWGLDITELERSYNDAKAKGVKVKALVFINPGNPTGQCLTFEQLAELCKFCHSRGIVLCCDEVYQENIYNDSQPFIPARKVLNTMPEHIRNGLQIVSFHTVSKGAYGECGLRGGYMEMVNFAPIVLEMVYKLASINLCPNVPGQVALGLMVNPPKRGDESYAQYFAEKDELVQSLKRRAVRVTEAFNKLEGVECQDCNGAMYSFPCVTFPQKFLDVAKAKNKAPDVLYCLELLDETGLSCVPGSGFQQAPGSYHFRTTILPQEEHFDKIISGFTSYHQNYIRRYGSPVTRSRD